MKIEETLPDKPNFLLIVLVSGAVILAILFGAWFVMHHEGGHFLPHHVATPATHNN